VGSCEHGIIIKPSGILEGGEFLDYVSDD